jgi:small subunit ribosomal protein S10
MNETGSIPIIRIILKAYESSILGDACKKIIADAENCNSCFSDSQCFSEIWGPIPLPTRIRRYCILTSPHVYKNARDHLEIRTHKRIIDIAIPYSKKKQYLLLEILKKVEIPPGVDITVKKAEKKLNR